MTPTDRVLIIVVAFIVVVALVSVLYLLSRMDFTRGVGGAPFGKKIPPTSTQNVAPTSNVNTKPPPGHTINVFEEYGEKAVEETEKYGAEAVVETEKYGADVVEVSEELGEATATAVEAAAPALEVVAAVALV